jgi:hypothetical protein
MKTLLMLLTMLLLVAPTVLAGKNDRGAMVVHTDDAHSWTDHVCNNFDTWVPDRCEDLNTRTDKDEDTPALIWFIASFYGGTPGVTVVCFGHDHNLPVYYHNHWGFCGPAGTIEVPDTGWPDAPATAGNAVAFGSPVVDDLLFPFYYFDVWGFPGAYYGTAAHPTEGQALFVDDSNPPVVDACVLFGVVRWHEKSCNQCDPWPTGACCFKDGTCQGGGWDWCGFTGGTWLGPCTSCDPNPCAQAGACCLPNGQCRIRLEDDCSRIDGEFVGEGIPCDPDPCIPTSGVPEVSTETVSWGRVKTAYR